MNYDLIVKARQALEPLWKVAWLKGRCWGPKSAKNPYAATNITLCIGSELISVSQQGEKLVIHEFQRTTGTKLAQRARGLFRKAKLMPIKTREILSSSGYTAYCRTDGWRQEFDAGLTGEVDSRGAGSRELIKKIFEAHERVHPGCDPANVEILDPNMVKVGQLSELLAIERAG